MSGRTLGGRWGDAGRSSVLDCVVVVVPKTSLKNVQVVLHVSALTFFNFHYCSVPEQCLIFYLLLLPAVI